MYNLATVFDLCAKLSGILILLDAYCENINLDLKPAKVEVNQLLHNIYALYDDKIHRSSALVHRPPLFF